MNAFFRFRSFIEILRSSHFREDRFFVEVVSAIDTHYLPERMPFELQFVHRAMPESIERVRSMFARGIGIGIRRKRSVADSVYASIHKISHYSQRGVTEPWLERLIFIEEIPVCTEDEMLDAQEKGINLYTEAHLVLSERTQMLRFVLVDLEAYGLEDADREFISQMNRILEPLSAAYLHFRIHADRQIGASRLWQRVLGTAVIIGPIAWIIGFVSTPIAFLVAAIGWSVIEEVRTSMRLKQSGYTPIQLWKRLWMYAPLLVLSTGMAISMASLILAGKVGFAGLIFGFLSVTFPFFSFIQRLVEKRSAYIEISEQRKVAVERAKPLTSLAWSDLTQPREERSWLFAHVLAPCLIGMGIWMFPAMLNGWLLALVTLLIPCLAYLIRWCIQKCDRMIFTFSIRGRMTEK